MRGDEGVDEGGYSTPKNLNGAHEAILPQIAAAVACESGTWKPALGAAASRWQPRRVAFGLSGGPQRDARWQGPGR